MVDFQSRDTRTRGRTNDGDEPADDDAADSPESTPSDDQETTEASTASTDSAADVTAGIAVLTITDEGTIEADPVGDAVVEALAGHTIVTRELLSMDHDSVQQSVDTLVSRDDVDAVVTAGGTGIRGADVTIEAVHPLFEKAMPGFGELFRHQYYDTVGTDVIASRATAGIADGTPVFCLPGAVEAARLGARDIVAEQAGRLLDNSTETTQQST